MEEWKEIEGYNNYKINKKGEVYNGDDKIVPFLHNRYKIPFVSLKNNKDHNANNLIARLVYTTFIEEIKDGTKLIYKDSNPHNYCLDNLEVINRYKKINPDKPIKLDKNKKWKQIKGYEELYKISDHGDVYSVRLNKILNPIKNASGYFRITLTKNKKGKKYYVHRLVIESFFNIKLTTKDIIDHINRIRTDNCLENLRVTDHYGNAQNTKKKEQWNDIILQYDLDNKLIKEWSSLNEIISNKEYRKGLIQDCCLKKRDAAFGFIWRYRDYAYDKTGFVTVKTDDGKRYSFYKINKDGVIINKHGRIKKQHVCQGYKSLSLVSDCGKSKHFKVHRLMAFTFLKKKKNTNLINHIDEDKFNNKLENLEWCDHRYNSRHSLAKKVQMLDLNTDDPIRSFDAITDALEFLGKSPKDSGIGQVCKGKSISAYGYKWKFI